MYLFKKTTLSKRKGDVIKRPIKTKTPIIGSHFLEMYKKKQLAQIMTTEVQRNELNGKKITVILIKMYEWQKSGI